MSKCPLFLPYLPIPSPLSLQKVHELGSQCLAVSFQLEGQEGVSSRPPPMDMGKYFPRAYNCSPLFSDLSWQLFLPRGFPFYL